MANLPYVNAYGKIPLLFEKISAAQVPQKFTISFMETKLGFKSTSDRAFPKLLDKLGFLTSDKTPTDLYRQYKNPTLSKAAMASALRHGYRELFEVNEYAGDLTGAELEGAVAQVTGLDTSDQTFKAIVATFQRLRELADFDASLKKSAAPSASESVEVKAEKPTATPTGSEFGFGISYTINLNLPDTTDVEVFNAIFRSLRENLLSD